MCGLSGELRFDGAEADIGAVGRMAETMHERGPDGSGLWSQGPVALGHRRLKIIDLSDKAAQPMVDGELGLAVVFNGCLYNYGELRAELRGAGYRFFSASDTEVLLKAFHRWGPACVRRFKGMFAFAVHERDTGRLILGRDRLGVKPMYVSENARRLRFASSLPALLAAGEVDTGIDLVALHHYMTFHSLVPGERTILSGVRKLPPATVRVIEPDGGGTEHRYWEPSHTRSALPEHAGLSGAEWCRAVLDALRVAVRRRMVADVPVGVLLSGGLDSSLIVALLAEQGQQDLATFSIGFEPAGGEPGEEFAYSDLVAPAVRHRPPPHPHPGRAPAGGAAGGGAGDERADGQPRLRRVLPAGAGGRPARQGRAVGAGGRRGVRRLQLVPAPGRRAAPGRGRRLRARVLRPAPRRAGRDPVARPAAGARRQRRTSSAPTWPGRARETALDAVLRLETTAMLVDDPVKRVDNMTMAHGLEARTPFLDHELVELAAACPAELKLAHGGKGVLKDAARRLLPAEVVDRPKGYFPVPAVRHVDGDAARTRPRRADQQGRP
ncbi:hypothetical protein GCM10020220_106980 [Nonomuraea rubra]